MPRDHALDRELARLDPLHHLDLVPTIFRSCARPVVLVGDEERRLPGVAVRGLHDEVVAQARRRAPARAAPRSRSRGPSCSARSGRRPRCPGASSRSSSPSGGAATPAGRRRPARARAASSSVSSSNIRNAALPPPRLRHEVADLLVPEEVVHDLLDRLERARRLLLRHEHVRVHAVERVVVVHEPEVAHPPVDPEQVERRRAHEVDGRLVRPEEVADRRDARQRAFAVISSPGRRSARFGDRRAASASRRWTRDAAARAAISATTPIAHQSQVMSDRTSPG